MFYVVVYYQKGRFLYKQEKQKIKFSCIIKPSIHGSSVGIGCALNIKELEENLKEAFLYDNIVLAEEFISGREITCGVLLSIISYL